MLSFLFLVSVANANNAFSASNEFTAAAQRLTSQLQAQMYIPTQNGRRLSSAKPCRWKDEKCHLDPQFTLDSGELDKYPHTKTWTLLGVKCEALKTQADCGKEAKCKFKDNKCSTSDEEGSAFMNKVIDFDSCGAVIKATLNRPAAPEDVCNKKDKTGCTDTCEWQEEYSVDGDNKKCNDDSKCVTKHVDDPNDPYQLKKKCPTMTDTQKDECEKKDGFQAKFDCFVPICFDYAGALSYMTCMAPKDEDSCKKAASVCAWDGTAKKCNLDSVQFYSSLIPDGCSMKALFMGSMTCGNLQDKEGCEKDDNKYKCKWEKRYSCDKTTVETSERCGSADDQMSPGLVEDIMGANLVDQYKKCDAVKTEAACGDVENTLSLSMGAVPAISTFTTFLVGFLVAP